MYSVDFLKPQLTIAVKDKDIGLIGYLVIDKFVHGASCGGIRMAYDISIDEIANLAYEMTKKFSFVNIPLGGAKAGVALENNSDSEQRKKIFFAFGSALKPLLQKGIYLTGEDLGTYPEDLINLFKGAGINLNKAELERGNSGYYTALTVFLTTKVLKQKIGLTNRACNIGIEGFGKVGRNIAKLILNSTDRIVAVSTLKGALYNPSGLDIKSILELSTNYGDEFIFRYNNAEQIPKELLLISDVNILIPCARPDSINVKNVGDIKAKLIVPGANVPYSSEIEEMLTARNICCVPGFVSNCGGILKGFFDSNRFPEHESEIVLRKYFSEYIEKIFDFSLNKKISFYNASIMIADNKLLKIEQNEALSKIEKLIICTKNWKEGGTRELIDLFIWHLYQFSIKYHFRFITKRLGERYIKNKLFSLINLI